MKDARNNPDSAQLDTKVFELQALYELSRQLTSSLNLKEILDTILLTPMGKMLISKGLVFVSEDGSRFVIKTSKGLPKSILGISLQIDDLPMMPEFVSNLVASSWQEFLQKNEIELVIPIIHGQKKLGVIGFGKKIIGEGFTDAELEYLNSLSNIAATAVQNGLYVNELDLKNRELEKQKRDLKTLFEIGEELKSTSASDEVLNLLAYSIMGELVVNKCLILMEAGARLSLRLNKGFPEDRVLQIINQDQVRSELSNLTNAVNLHTDQELTWQRQLAEISISVLVPMRVQQQTRGLIALGDKITRSAFREDELEFLTTLGNSTINYLETLEKKRLEEELQIASDIQKQLLPESCPQIENFEVAAVNISSLQVGGDYYDCLRVSEDEYAFCIADVSGKGAPAALLMSNLQASLNVLLATGLEINEITNRINNLIYKNTGFDKFITFFLGILNLKDRTFTSVNAGHNPPYLFHKDKSFQTFDEGGLILGMMPNMPYNTETVHLQSGDCIVMFTDGVSEAMNGEDEEFEECRIEKCIAENYDLSAQGILDRLKQAVMEFSEGQPQADDITIQIIKVI